MYIIHPQSYLVLGSSQGYKNPSIKITPDFTEVLSNWSSGTRCSPVWRIQVGETTNPSSERSEFPNDHLLILLGPIQLASLCSDIKQVNDPDLFTVWVSVGTLNVVLQADLNQRSSAALKDITRWVSLKNGALEWWEIRRGVVINGGTQVPSQLAPIVPENIRTLANSQVPSILKGALQEYCLLMASALCRSRELIPYLHGELLQINEVIVTEFELFQANNFRFIDIYLRMLNINASLSRFTSQAFSGIPPVMQTESHYWIHSLLGTGSANIAISKLSTHVRRTLGEARIPERLEAMHLRRDKIPSLETLSTDPGFLKIDHLIEQEPTNKGDPLIPLITYFSGRDGFSSHIYTLSAPLTTIAECNSLRSSLLTITHELSHIQIRGVLSVVYPDIDNKEHIELAIQMLRPNYKANNWLESAKQLILEAVVSMDQEWRSVERLGKQDLHDPEIICRLLRNWRREAQEILVHTFDFLYFYSSKPDIYISSIWHSWCAIPGIADRVPEYVIRTLSATGTGFLQLEHGARLEAIRANALGHFKALQSTRGTQLSNYVDLAIEHLEQNWQSSNGKSGIQDKLRAGLILTRFVNAFLYSETFAAKIYSETYIASSSVKESGYALKKYEFNLTPIGNPLRFLSENIKDEPTETESLWVLHNLAFNSAAGLES